MKKILAAAAFTLIGLLWSAAPSYAECVMTMEQYENVTKTQKAEIHKIEGARLEAFRLIAQYTMEPDGKYIVFTLFPSGTGYMLEMGDDCPVYLGAPGPVELFQGLLTQIDKATADAKPEKKG